MSALPESGPSLRSRPSPTIRLLRKYGNVLSHLRSHLPDANGHSDFGVLQTELGAKGSDKIVFYAFDLL